MAFEFYGEKKNSMRFVAIEIECSGCKFRFSTTVVDARMPAVQLLRRSLLHCCDFFRSSVSGV